MSLSLKLNSIYYQSNKGDDIMQDSLEAVKLAIGAAMIGASSYGIADEIRRIVMQVRKDKIENVELTDWQLAIGYKENGGIKHPVIVDFKHNPHAIISGLSQCGKTKMLEYALRDKQVILINTFKRDFTTCRNVIERINTPEEATKVFEYLLNLKEGENERPIYVVIDELLSLALAGDKQIMPLVTRLLALGAHMNVYVVAISQSAEKDYVSCKNLFNTRICFRMRDDSAYRVVLGFKPPDDFPPLERRQFFYLTNEFGTAYTYDV